jgi:hypothetical protein
MKQRAFHFFNHERIWFEVGIVGTPKHINNLQPSRSHRASVKGIQATTGIRKSEQRRVLKDLKESLDRQH